MPLYNYKCSKCGKSFELLSNLSARNEPKECMFCNGIAKKVYSHTKVLAHDTWNPNWKPLVHIDNDPDNPNTCLPITHKGKVYA